MATPASTAVVSLREITSETVRAVTELRVAPGQERFVAPNAVSIAQAYFSREAWFRAVTADDTLVGFVMLADPTLQEGMAHEPHIELWRFMIDARYQRMGFGRRALDLVVRHARTRPGVRTVLTSCVPGEGTPKPFYLGYGFRDTGRVEEGEHVLALEL